jgi:hypothetical protein
VPWWASTDAEQAWVDAHLFCAPCRTDSYTYSKGPGGCW